MSTQIKLFGQLAEIVGSDELQFQEANSTETVREKIVFDFPILKDYPFVIAVNKKIIKQNQTINAGDMVALLPPFSGG